MTSTRRAIPDRVPETDDGLQGDMIAAKYDQMQRHIRDQGWLQEKVDNVLESGITTGTALEVGCGPGFLGLEWITQASRFALLVGLDVSEAMLARARANAAEYGVVDRCEYDCANVLELPYEDGLFESAFTASSLHEWADPVRALNEVHRVLRPGGRYCITDLRRDIDRVTFQFMKANIAADMRPGFRSSVRSSYLKAEVEDILRSTEMRRESTVIEVQMGLVVTGRKETE